MDTSINNETTTSDSTDSNITSKVVIAAGVATGIIIAVGVKLPAMIRRRRDDIALGEAQMAVALDPENHVVID